MDNTIIYRFLHESLTQEQYDEYITAFGIIEDFHYTDPYTDIIGVLMDSGNSTNASILDFIDSRVHTILDYILKGHNIALTEDADKHIKITILKALYDLQHLTDYGTLTSIIYSSDDIDEVLSLIVEERTGIPYTTIIPLIEDVDDTLLSSLRVYIDSKVEDTESVNKDILNRINMYVKVVDDSTLVNTLLSSYVVLGAELDLYLNYLKDIPVDTVESLASSITGLILYTGARVEDILDVYHANSSKMLDDLATISKVNTLISKIVGEIHNYKDALKEADRVTP